MAFFLDPELNALTTGAKAAPSSSKAFTRRRTPNRFSKPCHKCSTYVKAQEGYLDKVAGAWVVYCTDCP